MRLEYIHAINEDVLNEGKLRAYILGLTAIASIVGAPFVIRAIQGPEKQKREMLKQGEQIIKNERIPIESIPIPPELAPIVQQIPVPIPNPIQSTPETQSVLVQDKQDTQEEVIYLARILFAEAANQSKEAKEAVAQVILNRVDRSGGKKTIIDVITQKYQFTGYRGKLWDKCENPEELTGPNKKAYAECLDVARRAVNKTMENRIGKATLYHDDSIDTPKSWDKNKIKFVAKIGAFTFYEEIR